MRYPLFGVFALTAAALAPIPAAQAQFVSGVYTANQSTGLEPVQFYLWGGHHYCWYDGGWHGPGFYWCGYPWRYGLGWGGGWGWHGWRGGHRGGFHGGYRGGYHGGHGGGFHGGHGGFHGGGHGGFHGGHGGHAGGGHGGHGGGHGHR